MFAKFIRYWLPPLIWMTIIFLLSARSRFDVTDSYTVSFIIFKTLHMIEYATLYFLLFRAFYSLQNKSLTLNKRMILPLIVSILYAASDEIHQTFTPTREGKPRDVLIDTIGITLMYIYIKLQFNFVKKFL